MNDITKYIKNNKIELTIKNEKEYMPIDEFSRWCALIEGINKIVEKAEKVGINIHRNTSWVKPLPINNYINERANYIQEDLEKICTSK